MQFIIIVVLGMTLGCVILWMCGMESQIEKLESTIASLKKEVETNGSSDTKK